MILRGMTPRRLSWSGKLAVLGLSAALLPIGPSLAQQPAAEPTKDESNRIIIIQKPAEPAEAKTIDIDVQVEKAKKHLGNIQIEIDDAKQRKDVPRVYTYRYPQDAKTTVAPEKAKEIAEAEAEVQEAQTRLKQAVERLVKLKGGKTSLSFTVQADDPSHPVVYTTRPDVKVETKTARVFQTPITVTSPRSNDPERRMAEVEKKLEKVLQELDRIKKEKDQEDAGPVEPRRNPF